MPKQMIGCSQCGRERPHSGRGLCGACYQRWWNRENPAAFKIRRDRNRANSQLRAREKYRLDKAAGRREANKERHRAMIVDWARRNPDKVIVQKERRIAIKNALPATLTADQWKAIKVAYDQRCAYCGGKRQLTQDHVLAVTKGGGYVAENIVPACQPCNSRKGNKPPIKIPALRLML